jgi:hypothetical protein
MSGRGKNTLRKGKRRKTWRRGSSPSHFHLSEVEELKFGPAYSVELPDRDRADHMFRAVSNLYYQPKDVHSSGQSVWVDHEYNKSQYVSDDFFSVFFSIVLN